MGPDAPDGVVVLLGDQPLLTTPQLTLLTEAASRSSAPIVAAAYGGRRGNPVYFTRALFPELMSVAGDEAGRAVIAQHSGQVALCELGDMHADLDIDTPADYERALAWWTQRTASDRG
jgi:molybdenum cofactor cytidylyltransferase